MQYETTESALNALKKVTNLRCYKIIGEERTPAEIWLVKHLAELWAHREKVGKRKSSEKEFRHLKSIARGLGLWDKDYIKVLVRLGAMPPKPIFSKFDTSNLSSLVKTTEELLEDATALESYIKSARIE